MVVAAGNFLTPMLAGVQAMRQSWRSSYYYLTTSYGIMVLFFVFLYGRTKYIPICQSVVVNADPPSLMVVDATAEGEEGGVISLPTADTKEKVSSRSQEYSLTTSIQPSP